MGCSHMHVLDCSVEMKGMCFFCFCCFPSSWGCNFYVFFLVFALSLLPGDTPEDAVGMLSTAGVKTGVPWQNKEFNLSINIWANVSLFFMQIFGATIRWNLSLVLTNPVKPTVRNAKTDGGNRVSVRDRALMWSIFSCGGQYRKFFSQRDIHERQTFLRSPPAGWWDLFRSPQHGSILACCPKSGERFFAQRPAKWVEFWDCRQKSDTFHKKMVKNTEVLSKNSSGGEKRFGPKILRMVNKSRGAPSPPQFLHRWDRVRVRVRFGHFPLPAKGWLALSFFIPVHLLPWFPRACPTLPSGWSRKYDIIMLPPPNRLLPNKNPLIFLWLIQTVDWLQKLKDPQWFSQPIREKQSLWLIWGEIRYQNPQKQIMPYL